MNADNRFRILVTGSRTWDNSTAIRDALEPYRSRDAVLVHGDARGADKLAAAIWRRWGKPDEPHAPDWDRDKKAAGYRRNQRMVDLGADVCLTFIREESRGASHAAQCAEQAGIRTIRHDYTPPTRSRQSTPEAAADSERPQGYSYRLITTALTKAVGKPRAPREPQQWTNYLCPVHEGDGGDHTPSLGVRYDPEQGKTIVRCWATCDDAEVLRRLEHPTERMPEDPTKRRRLEVRDMWDRLPARGQEQGNRQREGQGQQGRAAVEQAIAAARLPILSKPDLGRPTGQPYKVDTYIYTWPDGRPEGAITRLHTPHEHGHKKDFPQAHWTGTSWEPGGFAPIPWQLNEIRHALDTGADIYVCEGEKDVQSAQRAGLYATCNAMGAGSWTDQHARWLTGANRVVVVADRDRPGYRHAAKVADSLTGRVGEIRVVQARDGKDLTDHFAAGHYVEDLEPVPYLDRPPPRSRTNSRTRSR